jgi:acetylornithine deacetylase
VVSERTTIDRERLFNLFAGMVDIYSPSGKEEEVTDYLASAVRAGGLPVVEQEVDGSRRNLLVCGDGESPTTLFLGHVDTVPAFDIERSGFSAADDGECSGLGTADMKGGCAAMVEAFLTFCPGRPLPGGVALALVVGEEENGDGTQALLEEFSFREAIVAEPTGLRPCLSHYGYVEVMLRAFGYRRHAAMSGRETNAIRAMLRLLLRIEDRVEAEEEPSILNVRDLHSSESGFAVPDRCSATVDVHLRPEVSAGRYGEDLCRFADDILAASRASRHEIEVATVAEGYRADPGGRLATSLRRVLEDSAVGWHPDAFRSHSDANLLYEQGCAPIVMGPGQLAKAHTLDESVPFEQVAQASQLYTDLLANLSHSAGAAR